MTNKLIAEEVRRTQWEGMIHKCSKCNLETIWSEFFYCPMCGNKIDYFKSLVRK
jgi:predicted RNA-binding Zn-ribbon protein involved in translation (DUF1610 family)